jgi:hypothetical protein
MRKYRTPEQWQALVGQHGKALKEFYHLGLR